MSMYFLTFRSVTFAQRGERVLNSAGYHCTLQRTPRWMEEQGCGYALRIWTGEIRSVLRLLEQERIPVKRLYLQDLDGKLEEQPL